MEAFRKVLKVQVKRGIVVKLSSPKALRKRLGIKRLKKKIPASELEKAAIASLREHEKHRIVLYS